MGSYEIVNSPQQSSVLPPIATPIATTLSQHLPHAFFARPAEVVAPELIGCLLVMRLAPKFPNPGTNAEGLLQAL